MQVRRPKGRSGCWITALVCILVAVVPLTYIGYHFGLRHLPALFNRPLAPSVAADLCRLLQLEGDPRCRGKVFVFDFFPDLRDRYPRGSSRAQVAAEIGPYHLSCTEWISRGDNGDFQDCRYGFDGDRGFLLFLTLWKETGASVEEAAVWRTCTYAVGNGSLWNIFACQPPLNSGLLLVMSDNTLLVGGGFSLVFLVVDLAIVGGVVWLWQRESSRNGQGAPAAPPADG